MTAGDSGLRSGLLASEGPCPEGPGWQEGTARGPGVRGEAPQEIKHNRQGQGNLENLETWIKIKGLFLQGTNPGNECRVLASVVLGLAKLGGLQHPLSHMCHTRAIPHKLPVVPQGIRDSLGSPPSPTLAPSCCPWPSAPAAIQSRCSYREVSPAVR